MYVRQCDIDHPWREGWCVSINMNICICPHALESASVWIYLLYTLSRHLSHIIEWIFPRLWCLCALVLFWLCEALTRVPFKRASSHLYVCICTLKTLATELRQTTTDTAMTFDTFKEVAEFKGGTLFWFPTTVFFFLHRFIFRGTDLKCSEYMYWVCAYCTSCARC